MLYVPVGFGHGFQTLEDMTDVTYQVSHPYTPGAEGGAALGRPGDRHRLAAAGLGDLGEGCGLAADPAVIDCRRRLLAARVG